MIDRVEIAGLKIARVLHDFVEGEVLPGTGLDAGRFWKGLAAIFEDLSPRNRALLARRCTRSRTGPEYHELRNRPIRPRGGRPSQYRQYSG